MYRADDWIQQLYLMQRVKDNQNEIGKTTTTGHQGSTERTRTASERMSTQRQRIATDGGRICPKCMQTMQDNKCAKSGRC